MFFVGYSTKMNNISQYNSYISINNSQCKLLAVNSPRQKAFDIFNF